MNDSGIRLPDGIYEETNIKMVFLVKDSEIYRLIWNHVKEGGGIVSREIYNITDYEIGNRGDNGEISLKNGLLFQKIDTNIETVKERVQKLYNENMEYLNMKFFQVSSGGKQVTPGESGLTKPVIDTCQKL